MSAHEVFSIVIGRSSMQVFDIVHDYHRRLEWDTLLRRAETLEEESPAKGVVAVCAARWYLGGLVFSTRYVSFVRPTLAAVTLVRPYFVFDMWSASIRHRDLPVSPSVSPQSELTYTLTFRCRPRWVARPIERIAMIGFRRETRRRLLALKKYAESEERLVGE